jgi:UDP-N-acetyl-2-amino-2-deoxyglucuronate dehydrogenase
MPMRAALVGLGMAVDKHARALKELAGRVEVAACWSPTAARRSAFAAAHALPVTDSLDAILDDRSIDLVFILTPPWTHLDLATRCVAAGKHILLEKPIEATLERSERLVAMCGAAGVKLGIVFQNRFRTPHLRLAALLREGRLGDLISVSISVRWWRPDSYFAEPGRGIRARDGGGVLLTQAIHSMDQLVALTGPVESVCAFAATSPLRRIDTEDVVAAALRFPSGAIGTLDATTTSFPGSPERIDIAGRLGAATLERRQLRVWLRDGTVIDEQEDAVDPAVQGDHLAHRRLIEDMIDAIEQAREPGANGLDALVVHRLIEAVLRSADSGRFELVAS